MDETSKTNNAKLFAVDKAKTSRAICKICNKKCLFSEIRIARYIPDVFGNDLKKKWHHVDCIFKKFLRQRLSTKRIKSSEDLDGWNGISVTDQKMIEVKIRKSEENISKKYNRKTGNVGIRKNRKEVNKKNNVKKLRKTKAKQNLLCATNGINNICNNNEDAGENVLFKNLCDFVNEIINCGSYIEKFCTISKIFTESTSIGIAKKNNLKLFCKLLFLNLDSKKNNIHSKQLAKIFAKLFSMDFNEIHKDSEMMNLSDSIAFHFTQTKKCKPANVNTLTLLEVEEFLNKLYNIVMRIEEHVRHFEPILSKCTVDELKVLIRLVQHDLYIDMCVKHVLKILYPEAYQLFQTVKTFDAVIDTCINMWGDTNSANAKLFPMALVLPALTENCASIEQAVLKYPEGVFCQINYGGERVHFHKKNSDFKFYSYTPEIVGSVDKITNLKELVFDAFPRATKLIIDCEILPFDTKTRTLLSPKNSNIRSYTDLKHIVYCIVVIDCMFYDADISKKPLRERREILKNNMIEIPNLLILSEAREVQREEDMNELVAKMLRAEVDGLILKDIEGIYTPGQKQWLKIKRNSFMDDNTAITMDLIVLGGWNDTKKESDFLSIFLMGCFDQEHQRFRTVAKVYMDSDDKRLEYSAEKMNMIQISCDESKIPDWLCCTKDLVPEFVAEDPQSQPVWKITGLEFLKDNTHSSEGISLRFPQITCKENGKNWKKVIDLASLKKLYEESNIDVLSVGMEGVSSSRNLSNGINVQSENNKNAKRKIKNSPAGNPKKKTKRNQSLNNSTTNEPQRDEAPVTPTNIPEESQVALVTLPEITVPNYFANVFLLLDEHVKNRHTQWVRSFVACGGTLVPDYHRGSATHVLHLYDEEPLERMYRLHNVVHIIVEWIKDTLRDGVLKDDKPYRVRLKGRTRENNGNSRKEENPSNLSSRAC